MRRLAVFALVVAAAVAAWFLGLKERIPAFMEWIQGLGLAGALLFGGLYALATVLMIPGSLITLLAGAVYGPWWGTALVSPASVLGAALAFLLGRSLFRDALERRYGASPRFRALQRAMEREGGRIVLLVRLSPVFPFNLVNYLFGLTPVRFPTYVLASFVGMLPGTFLYVYLGSTIGDLARIGAGETPDAGVWGWVAKTVGLLATVAVTVVVTRAARRALREELGDADTSPATGAATP